MEKDKLISMVDFVKSMSKTNGYDYTDNEWINVVVSYANFLSQPLTLGMFVPCLDGVVLEEPKGFKGISFTEQMHYDSYESEYQQAKERVLERVLFEGVEIKWCKSELDGLEFYGVTLNGQWCGSWENFLKSYLKNGETIEALTILKDKLIPTLTETALKQIGLNN